MALCAPASVLLSPLRCATRREGCRPFHHSCSGPYLPARARWDRCHGPMDHPKEFLRQWLLYRLPVQATANRAQLEQSDVDGKTEQTREPQES
jgi:hypothetical protein